MAAPRIFDGKSLGELVSRLVTAGWRVVAPVESDGQVRFAEVSSAERIQLDYIQTGSSAKPAVFPRYEPLLRYQLCGKEVAVEEVLPEPKPTLLFGVHPCDAASFATLRAVFTWDSPDAYFEPRLAQLTVVGLSCTRSDAHCFCTSVGGGPGDSRGSDILLTPVDQQRYRADILTQRGQALVSLVPQLFADPDGTPGTVPLAEVPVRFKLAELSACLPQLFGRDELWIEQSLRCIGCGACAYVCPTCSCFDIQDERVRDQGVRLRCWDSCGFRLFTLHASGHNPRARQFERWRQRLMHKFAYQPERLGVLGCVGCGRCSRACPADMELAEHLQALAETGV
jgi:formate hydrogenlyase subunit 6/NADH:ubiquinone oxidoreductase subunit I